MSIISLFPHFHTPPPLLPVPNMPCGFCGRKAPRLLTYVLNDLSSVHTKLGQVPTSLLHYLVQTSRETPESDARSVAQVLTPLSSPPPPPSHQTTTTTTTTTNTVLHPVAYRSRTPALTGFTGPRRVNLPATFTPSCMNTLSLKFKS